MPFCPSLSACSSPPRLLSSSTSHTPRPSSYPLLGTKYLLLGTIYPQLRVQVGSWNIFYVSIKRNPKSVKCMYPATEPRQRSITVLPYVGRVHDRPNLKVSESVKAERTTWVVAKIMVPLWIPIIIRHLRLRVPNKGP